MKSSKKQIMQILSEYYKRELGIQLTLEYCREYPRIISITIYRMCVYKRRGRWLEAEYLLTDAEYKRHYEVDMNRIEKEGVIF